MTRVHKYQNQDKTNKKNLHGSSITSSQTRQGQIRTLHVSFPIPLPLQYSYLPKSIHITCRHEHPTNAKSCEVLFSPLSYRWETGTELNWARSCSHQVSELGLELIQSDSRVCALHTPATLTLPRFLCCPRLWTIQLSLSWQCCFTYSSFCLHEITYSYLPITIYNSLSAPVLIFMGAGKIRMKNEKRTVNARMKAYRYGKGGVLSSAIYRSNRSGGFINCKATTKNLSHENTHSI